MRGQAERRSAGIQEPGRKDARHTRVKVGLRFCRIAFPMVAGRQVFRHPGFQGRHYILDKLMAFHRAHGTGMAEVLRDLQAAVDQLPKAERAAEAKPLQEELQKIKDGGRRGPHAVGIVILSSHIEICICHI